MTRRKDPEDFLRTGGALEAGLGRDAFSDGATSPVEIGQTIGKVRIVETIGSGGMGDVFLGIDERLDRKVAVKTLLPGSHLTPSMKRRFLNEAKVLSRLDHPAICRLYDLVEETERSCLMLEYVDGTPLDQLAGSLDEQDILNFGMQIAEALAAAHREGVVHRDVKPSNVMIAADSTVKILDFGISRLMEDVASESLEEPGRSAAQPPPGATATGSIIGTPRFMSPEQARGEPVTPASDLFSFGLTLCALVTGHSPILEQDPLEALEATANARCDIPDNVSPALGRLIENLTRLEPSLRPTAAEVVDRLTAIVDAPRRRRRRTILGLAGIAVLAALALAVGLGKSVGEGRYRCRGFERYLEGIWDPAAGEALERAFASTDAAGIFTVVKPVLDAYAEHWIALRSDACESTWVRAEQSTEMLDLENACFDRRLQEFASLISVLGDDPAGTRFKAAQAAHALTPPSECLNTELLSAEVPLPEDPAVRTLVVDHRGELARIKTLYDTGNYPNGWEAIEQAEAGVLKAGYAPLTAEFSYLKALLAEKQGAMPLALSTLEDAVLAGESGRHDRLVARAWIRRVWVSGVILTDFESADLDIRFARAALDRIGEDAGLEGALANHRSIVESFDPARAEHALSLCYEALAWRRRAWGERHPKVASTMQNCSTILRDLDRTEESLALAQEAYEMRLELLGPEHPSVLISLNGLASTLDELDRTEEAAELMEEALDLAQEAYPTGHPAIARMKINLANTCIGTGNFERALRFSREAAESLTETLGPDSLAAANAWYNLSLAARHLKDWELTEEASARARDVFLAIFGPGDTRTIKAEINLGVALAVRGRFDRSVEMLSRTLEAAEQSISDPILTNTVRVSLANTLIDGGGDVVRARGLLEAILGDLEDREDPNSLELVEDVAVLMQEL